MIKSLRFSKVFRVASILNWLNEYAVMKRSLLLIRVISVKAGSILLVWDTFIQDVPVDIKRDLK